MQCSERRDRRDGIYWPRDTAGKMVPVVAAHARGRRAQATDREISVRGGVVGKGGRVMIR